MLGRGCVLPRTVSSLCGRGAAPQGLCPSKEAGTLFFLLAARCSLSWTLTSPVLQCVRFSALSPSLTTPMAHPLLCPTFLYIPEPPCLPQHFASFSTGTVYMWEDQTEGLNLKV